MDRISELPESIVHRILRYFNDPAELVRMSVLSNHWFHLTASFPILDFSIDKFTNVSREYIFKYVQYTTSRFCHQNVTAHTLKIVTTILEPAELDIINHCLELVLKKGMQILVVDVTNLSDSPMPKYRLPNILLSLSMLKYLAIRRCELPSSLMCDVVEFKSLFHLTLENVTIDEQVIKHLATSCPRLQELEIKTCHGLKRLCIDGHRNLQKVFVIWDTQIERIDIEAPNLSTITLADKDGGGAPQMNLASCEKLTTVAYFGHRLTNSNGCSDFLSNFPFVEHLYLATNKVRNLKLSSDSLKTLVLLSECELEDIEFITPNLVFFFYSCNNCLACPMIMDILDIIWPPVKQYLEAVRVTNLSNSKGYMRCYLNSCIDALWFQKLRLFLDKKNGFKVLNLYIQTTYSQKIKELEKLKAIELPPFELEHVELQLDTHEELSAHVAFVDAVLWCFRPQSLTLISPVSLIDIEDVVKFTYEKLLQQEDEDGTKMQIVLPSFSEAQKRLSELKSLLRALPHAGKTVTFMKEKCNI